MRRKVGTDEETVLNNQDFYAGQQGYMDRVRRLAASIYERTPMACVITYGCQQNVSDSERTKGMLEQMGYTLTEEPAEADFVLYNTCAVREHAEERVYGNLGAMKHLKRRKPDMILGLCGCMAQQGRVGDRIRRSYPYVDLLFGTHVQHRLPEFLYRCLSMHERVFETDDSEPCVTEGMPVHRDGSYKAWLPVMYGCNNFCTYCIVPYVRGRERSRNPEDVLKEAKELIAAGYKDITLLGQNVNSYGKGEAHGVNFAGLLRQINDLPGDFRIRFMTSHPKDCTDELLDAMRDCGKVCHHLHLPFQSGSDRILKAMNRHYDRAGYLALVEAARKRMPDIQLTSDIIVGFPGETREDFEQTLSLIKEVRFASLFTFIYSPREGTPAAQMPDPVSRQEKGQWFEELLRTQEAIAKENNAKLIGRVLKVLCDDHGRTPDYMAGHSGENIVVEFPGTPDDLGKFFTVKIVSLDHVLKGEVLG